MSAIEKRNASYLELPTRIKDLLQSRGHKLDSSSRALKTEFKPNSTIPTIWIVSTNKHILLCSTHKTRGLWAIYGRDELNCVRLKRETTGGLEIEIIHADSDCPTLLLPLPASTNITHAEELVSMANAIAQ